MNESNRSRRLVIQAGAGLAAAGAGLLVWQLKEPAAAPAVRYTLLNGQALDSTAAWRGKVMLVNFWATSCTTCVKKMPMLVAAHAAYASRGFDVLAIAMQYDPPAYVSQFAESRRLPFGVAIDNKGELARAFGDVRVTPTTIVVDKQGHIAKRLVGDIPADELNALLERLLAA